MAFDSRQYAKQIEKIIAKYVTGSLAETFRSVAARISKRIEAGQTVEQAVLSISAAFPRDIVEAITPAVYHAACAGYGILPEIVANPEAVRTSLIEKSWTADKIKLSTRLHGTSDAMRQAIISEIRTALKENDSWRSAARRLYDGYGEKTTIKDAEIPEYLAKLERSARSAFSQGHLDKGELGDYLKVARQAERQIGKIGGGGTTYALKAAYKKLLKATQSMAADRIQNAIYVACNERARYYADRIARTEITRAWFDGFIAENNDDEDVIGYRWVLGSRHPDVDICDMHSKVDCYGLGGGCYPKNSIPVFPAHPHCLCHLTQIYVGEANEPHGFDQKAIEQYIRQAPEDVRKSILGVQGEQDWKAGKIGWEEAAGRLGWQGHMNIPGRIKPRDMESRGG